MWQESLPLLQKGEVNVDPFIFSKNDTRRGLTLICRPSAEILTNIKSFLLGAQAVAPMQYFYPESDIHLTVLSIISCYPAFNLQQINREKYIQLIKESLKDITPFNLNFKGITASPGTILIKGFDEKGTLQLIRNNLRTNFKKSRLQNSIDKRYKIQTAHLTVIRFKEQLMQPGVFIEFLKQNREVHFGTCKIDKLELVYNDWYQRKENVHNLETFKI